MVKIELCNYKAFINVSLKPGNIMAENITHIIIPVTSIKVYLIFIYFHLKIPIFSLLIHFTESVLIKWKLTSSTATTSSLKIYSNWTRTGNPWFPLESGSQPCYMPLVRHILLWKKRRYFLSALEKNCWAHKGFNTMKKK